MVLESLILPSKENLPTDHGRGDEDIDRAVEGVDSAENTRMKTDSLCIPRDACFTYEFDADCGVVRCWCDE